MRLDDEARDDDAPDDDAANDATTQHVGIDGAVLDAATLSEAEREALAVAGDPILVQMLDEERVDGAPVDRALLWRMAGYLRPHRALALGAGALAVLEALLMTLPAFLVGLAIDQVAVGAPREGAVVRTLVALGDAAHAAWMPDASRAEGLIVFFGAVIAVTWTLRWFVAVSTTYVMQRLGQLVVHDLRRDVYGHVMGMDAGYFHTNPVGRLVNRTVFDVQSISELFSDAMAQGVRDLIFVGVLMAVMLWLDLTLAAVVLLALPALVIIALRYRAAARPAMRTNSAVRSRMNAWVAENIAGMRENQLYRREARRRAEFAALTDAFMRSITRLVRVWSLVRPRMMMMCALITAAVLWTGDLRVSAGAITLGVVLTFIQYTQRLWQPVRSLVEKYNLIQTSLTAAERVMDVLDARSAMRDAPDADPSLAVTEGRVTFDRVDFSYPTRPDVPVLRGVSFEAQPGQLVALVGDTGAGKSTIAHLVSRFYDVTGGLVRVDGRDARDYTLDALRRGVAIVPQDVVLFAGSVRENITLGLEVDDARVRACVRAVCAEALIERLGGLEAPLAEGGKTLSAGERQLLSFARALVYNPPVLVLDEATASVDTRTEQVIQEALARLTQGRTTLAIAHRLSTIRDADLILVLRHGEVIERGTHDALLARGGAYARLYTLHMGAAQARTSGVEQRRLEPPAPPPP